MGDKKNGFHARTSFFTCHVCKDRYTCGWGSAPTTCANCLTKQEKAKAKKKPAADR